MNLAELLHFCLTAKRSGIIQCLEHEKVGKILLQKGEVIDAHWEDTNGEDAFFRLLLSPDATCEFHEQAITDEIRITRSTHYLLMEGARRSDESNYELAEIDPSKPHQSFGLILPTIDEQVVVAHGVQAFAHVRCSNGLGGGARR